MIRRRLQGRLLPRWCAELPQELIFADYGATARAALAHTRTLLARLFHGRLPVLHGRNAHTRPASASRRVSTEPMQLEADAAARWARFRAQRARARPVMARQRLIRSRLPQRRRQALCGEARTFSAECHYRRGPAGRDRRQEAAGRRIRRPPAPIADEYHHAPLFPLDVKCRRTV